MSRSPKGQSETRQPGSPCLPPRFAALGVRVAQSLHRVLNGLPRPHRPTIIARELGLSRVIVGKLINAVGRADPHDLLGQIPGPESLRAFVRAAGARGISADDVRAAIAAIDEFAEVVRREFGTRSAFNAALAAERPESRSRLVHHSRYQVHMGMRQILGVEADTWLTSMIFLPSRAADDLVDVTVIHGALGLRRLRSDVDIYFTMGPPNQSPQQPTQLAQSLVDLEEFYTHAPARLKSELAGGQLVHRLAQDPVGRAGTADMLTVGRQPGGSQRYATPQRPRGGLVVFPDVPVKMLVCDVHLHPEIFPGSFPELIVYNPGGRGPANPADRGRDVDRIEVPEAVQALGCAPDRFDIPEAPHYADMMARVCSHLEQPLEALRTFRLRMAYPVQGFQCVLAFDAPPRPE